LSLYSILVYIKYIDIHSHLGFEDYGGDKKEVINRMKESGVGTIAIGADLASSIEAVKVATENENIWACIGQHPTHNANINESDNHNNNNNNDVHGERQNQVSDSLLGFDEKDYEELVNNPKVVAVGECGLDYFNLEGDIEKIKDRQKEIFIKQINFALKYDKALMLHIRNAPKNLQGGTLQSSAFEDTLKILNKIKKEGGLKSFQGNVHFFTGKLATAQKFIELGFTISFVGLITYVNDFDKIIRGLPSESLQAETDSPYVAPVPYRGQRNEPSYVVEVYKKIAEIRGEDPEMVRLQLLENARRVFEI